MNPTTELFPETPVTMAELFGSDNEEEEVEVKVKIEPKIRPKKIPMKRAHHVRSSVRSILNQIKRRGKKVRKELITFSDKMDTRWLAENRLKQRVRPLVASYKRAMGILNKKQKVDRLALTQSMRGIMEIAVKLFRTQERVKTDLPAIRTELSKMKTQMDNFVTTILSVAQKVLIDIPPYLPDSEEILTASFFQLRAVKRPIDPKKLFSRRNQAAAKTMRKSASESIPDAAIPELNDHLS